MTTPSRIPQVIITLSPEGTLQAELPYSGGRRRVPVESLSDIHRILSAQLRPHESTIGLDGSPTSGQVRHWDRHENRDIKDPDCPWCIANELGIDTSREAYFRARKALHNARAKAKPILQSYKIGDGSARVTYLKTKSKKISPRKADFSDLFGLDDDEELGSSEPNSPKSKSNKKKPADFSTLFE